LKNRLTLGEKLKDLRVERKLTLADVTEATNISAPTLQRLEADDDIRVGYQDIEMLARFYDVSADYLFELTDNRQHRNVEMDKLRLSDEAITVLKDGGLNNRFISEFLSHPDFPQLLIAMEIYIDRKVLPQMRTLNSLFKYMTQTIQENTDVPDGDKLLAFLRESVVDEDDYLLYSISERFTVVMKSMFEAHSKDKISPEQPDMLSGTIESVETFLDVQKTESNSKARAIVFCKQLGLDASKLTDEEWRVLMKTLQSSRIVRRTKKRKR